MSTPERDPGLQPERTALAWQRTLLSTAGVALLIGVAAVRLGSPFVALIAAVLAAASGGLLASRIRGTWHAVRRSAWLVIALGASGAALSVQVLVAR